MIVNETKNTHEKVRDFQNRLYLTAKTSKKRRFHAMYDKIYRKDILEEAWKRVKINGGAGGIDKVTFYRLHKICKEISHRYKFTYNLDSILSRLIYGRILFPSSKLNTYQESKNLLEQPDFEIQHVYRALEVIAKETDYIQSELYKNSLSVSKKITAYWCYGYFASDFRFQNGL